MEKFVKHRFLNSVLFTALFVPLGFFLMRDTIAAITGIMFESIGGKESFLYQINEDIARLIIAGLLILIMPLFSGENAILDSGVESWHWVFVLPCRNLSFLYGTCCRSRFMRLLLLPESLPWLPRSCTESGRACLRRSFAGASPYPI